MIAELQIRNTALKLLTFAYRNMGSDFSVSKLDCTFLNISPSDLVVIQRYLKDKGFLKTSAFYCDNLSFTLTAEGIDWVEANNNIKLG